MTYEFDQQDHGAVMPKEVKAVAGTCSQCGREGSIAAVRLKGMNQDTTVTPCAECLFDIASGTDVVPVIAYVETPHGFLRMVWEPETRQPVIVDLVGLEKEVHELLEELKRIGWNDPDPFSEHYRAFLGSDRARTREIGERLDRIGTFRLMQAAFEALRPHLPPAGPVHLNHAWNDVGDWRS